jgi:argininosuccinate lyase
MGTARSAAIKFLVPPRAGVLRSIAGVEALASHPRIVRWHMEPIAGAVIGEPIDNACYLGHVAVVDPDGPTARELAEDVVRKLELVYEV